MGDIAATLLANVLPSLLEGMVYLMHDLMTRASRRA